MSQEVTTFIENLGQPWQQQLCNNLRKLVLDTIPNAEERIQYKKPHFLKNGKYAAVISPSKDAITFMIMNAKDVTFPTGFDGPQERKWKKIKKGDSPDYSLLGDLLKQASSSL